MFLSTGITNTGVKYKGHVEIPNLSDENDIDDIEVSTVNISDYYFIGLQYYVVPYFRPTELMHLIESLFRQIHGYQS